MNAELADQMPFSHHGDTEMHGDSALVIFVSSASSVVEEEV